MIGVGKSSLIKAMTALCRDIVHVDAVTRWESPTKRGKWGMRGKSFNNKPAEKSRERFILETFASTRPQFERQTGLQGKPKKGSSKVARDRVLERNLCFVDTYGPTDFPSSDSFNESNAIIDYVVSSFQNHPVALSDYSKSASEKKRSNGSSQVDVVLYMLNHGMNH